ncbi:MAG TPA: acyl-ACP--UDP-N-acetylglucosamine O-acyltransferase [Planctomycetota bacterium]|nr:acyl-ACP--UDP-N-acetylglucosamine O-acyltransferase [Planctomycetota bacterium]
MHPLAFVDPTAQVADGAEVGPFAFVGPHASIGPGTVLMHHASVEGWTRLGAQNRVFPYAAVGGEPQDLGYRGEEVRLEVGDRNVFREGVTVSRGTLKEQGVTRIGNRCLLMACSHVGHDCVIGDDVILSNAVLLAGHCHVEDRAILSGAAAVNHFTTIGRLAYVGGLSRIIMDVPPFMIVEGHPARVVKVNLVGLKRAGLDEERIRKVRHAFKALWRADQLVREKSLERLEKDEEATEETLYLAAFLRRQMAGKQGRAREAFRK